MSEQNKTTAEEQAEIDKVVRDAQMSLDEAQLILQQTETGKKYYDFAKTMGLSFAFDANVQAASAQFMDEGVCIIVNPSVATLSQAVQITLALVNVHNFANGHRQDADYHPESNYLINRFAKASAEANFAQAMFELEEVVQQPLMNSLISQGYDSIAAFKKLSDADANKGTDYVKSGQAWRAAFDQWFVRLDNRYSSDQESLKFSEQNMHNFTGPEAVKPMKFTLEQLTEIMTQPDGTNHFNNTKTYALDSNHYVGGLAGEAQLMLGQMLVSLHEVSFTPKNPIGLISPDKSQDKETKMETIGFINKEKGPETSDAEFRKFIPTTKPKAAIKTPLKRRTQRPNRDRGLSMT